MNLVVVSNRVSRGKPNEPMTGGLAAALLPIVEKSGAIWVGSSGRVRDGNLKEPFAEIEALGTGALAMLDLPAAHYGGYYEGFANSALWPALHSRADLIHVSADDYASYREVNAFMAKALLRLGWCQAELRRTKDAEPLYREGVDLRMYRVIYQLLDDIRQALSGMLAPEQREIELGRAEVRALFRTPRGVVAGCMVTGGQIARNSLARLVRDGVIVWSGRIGSLRRFKEDVREVAEGFECGIGLENFHDIHEGDVIETYEVRETARSLA